MKTPDQVFNDSQSVIHSLYKHSRNLIKLQKILLNYVPQPIFISSYENGLLHLFTNDGTLATHLRYNQQELLAKLSSNPQFHKLKKIKVSVRPDKGPVLRPASEEPIPINAENVNLITSSAEHIKNEGLRKALIKLATDGSKK